MPRHAAGRRPVDDEQGSVAPDPRHRPVLLHVAPRPHPLPDPRSLPVSMGTAVALAALMCLTVVSGWAGWRVAQAGSPAQALVAAPEVPRTPADDPQFLALDAVPPAAPVGAPVGQQSMAEVLFSGPAAVPGAPTSVPADTAGGPGTTNGSSTADSVVVQPAAAVRTTHVAAGSPTAAVPAVTTPPRPSPIAPPPLAAPSSAPVRAPVATPTAPISAAPPSAPADSPRSHPRASGTSSSAGHRHGDAAHPSGDRPRWTGEKSSPARSTEPARSPENVGDGYHHHHHGSATTSGRPASDNREHPAEETSRTCPSTRSE
jgi:hypothetical protein